MTALLRRERRGLEGENAVDVAALHLLVNGCGDVGQDKTAATDANLACDANERAQHRGRKPSDVLQIHDHGCGWRQFSNTHERSGRPSVTPRVTGGNFAIAEHGPHRVTLNIKANRRIGPRKTEQDQVRRQAKSDWVAAHLISLNRPPEGRGQACCDCLFYGLNLR